MRNYCLTLSLLLLSCAVYRNSAAQDSNIVCVSKIPARYLSDVLKNADVAGKKIDHKTAKALSQLKRREEQIIRKLRKIDSLAAKIIFTTAEQRYTKLEEKSRSSCLSQYFPFLDTIKSSLKFLDKNRELLEKEVNIQQQLESAMSRIDGLEKKLQKAEQVRQFLEEENQLLIDQLQQFGAGNQLKKLNKDIYYYNQQLAIYKETIKNPQKSARKAIDMISRTKVFQDFMRKNSMRAGLFCIPADDFNDAACAQIPAGLQTRKQIGAQVKDRYGSDANVTGQLKNNLQDAQGQLQQLRDKYNESGSGNTDDVLPGFKPNGQKTRTFLQRLEFGTSMQTVQSNGYLPVTTDLGVSFGYKLDDKSLIGIGVSYKIGWGQNIKQINISSQGEGLRCFIDWKLKKSIWLSGGFEMNYRPSISGVVIIAPFGKRPEATAWQQSGLIGLSKKFTIKTKIIKNTSLKLLWDFLSYQQVPRTQAVVLRVGYNL